MYQPHLNATIPPDFWTDLGGACLSVLVMFVLLALLVWVTPRRFVEPEDES